MPGSWTPSLHEQAVRLGSWVPFPIAATLVAAFTHTHISEPTIRRQTEAAGAAYVALQTAAVEHLEREAALPVPGPAVLQMSVDGAMVPLVGGAWAEVKTLAVGVVQPAVRAAGSAMGHTTTLSYFSRLADHETFTRLALVETHRRRVPGAGVVVALCDGAGWPQTFVDYHRPDAVRILDWCHAVGYLSQVASACFGGEVAMAAQWLATQTRELLEGSPDRVLDKLRGLHDELAQQPTEAAGTALATVTSSLQYLEARRAQIDYAAFRAAGYPIGSGMVESANKLVVEARLKGAGMHWARHHVDGMVTLRTIVCSDRWTEAWPQLVTELRRQARTRRQQQRQGRRAPTPAPFASAPGAAPPPLPRAVVPPSGLALPTTRHDDHTLAPPVSPAAPAVSPTVRARPAPNHPWRRYHLPLTVR